MGQIEVFFAGICVFFEDYSQLISSNEDPPVHRMVLVDGNSTSFVLDGQTLPISPHQAQLTLPPLLEFLADGPLPPFDGIDPDGNGLYSLNVDDVPDGAFTISVVNPDLSQGWTNHAGCLPHLATFLNGVLGPPSLPVVRDGAGAACYVDFRHGRIDGFNQPTATGASIGISRATVATTGDPQILIQGAGLRTTVTFTSPDAVIAVTNKGQGTSDAADDFRLNYLTCADQPNPADVTPPTDVPCIELQDPGAPPKFNALEAGPGCSNTNFP